MHWRRVLFLGLALGGTLAFQGCKSSQFAKILHPGESQMVGSHQAGQETFKPLVAEAVSSLLARHATPCNPVTQVSTQAHDPALAAPLRICFVAVENKSAEEIGDFKDQIYQVIDTQIVESRGFQPVNKRFVDAGLEQTRLRPDQLFVPQNMRAFTMAMEQLGQPFDFLLYATLTSGTTRQNQNYQRDYLLTMEIVEVRSGQYDKQSATISKSYYQTRLGRLFH